MKRVIEGATIWDGADSLQHDGAIVIDDGRIEAVLTRAERNQYPLPARVDRIDGHGRLAIPGLVNAHTHLYSSLARGMALPGYAPESFTQILEQLWWRLDKALDPESVRMSALVGAMEAARCGVTTLVDHHASPHAVGGSLSAVCSAVNHDVGLRGVFCYELSDRDGAEIRDQGIEENLRFLSADGETSEMSAGLFGLHASFTLSDESLQAVADRIPEGVGIHIHVAEGPEDEEQCHATHGTKVVDRLKRYGLLRERSILAHCLHVDEDEKDAIAASKAIVVHNPRSNMNNAVGVFDMEGFLNRGIVVGLGTDGLGANMLTELFTAGVLQKLTTGDSLAAGFSDLQKILFDNNPHIAERLLGVKVGRIMPGHASDIAMFDYEPPTPVTAANVLGHLLFGIAVNDLRVGELIVAGRSVIRDHTFAGVDEEAVYEQARSTADALWKRAA